MANVDAEGFIAISCALAADTSLLGSLGGSIPSVFLVTGNVTSAPRLVAAAALTAFKVRITFDQAMKNDSRLIDPANYFITPASDGVTVYVTNVTPENVTYPSHVDVDINEMTLAQGYQARVNAGLASPVNRFDTPVNPLGNTTSFIGEGERPTIVSIKATSVNKVEITFSEPMLDNDAIRDISNYIFDNGLTTISVLNVDSNKVELVTSDQLPGIVYNLEVG